MAQEIIVYRNPLEQQVWNSIMGLMESGFAFVVLASIFGGFVTFMIFEHSKLKQLCRVDWRYQGYVQLAAFCVGALCVAAYMSYKIL